MPVIRAAWLGRVPIWGFRCWSHANQFLGTPLIRAGSEMACWSAFLETLDCAGDKRIALMIDIAPADGPVIQELQRVCAATRRPYHIIRREQRPMLDLIDRSSSPISSKRSARLRSQAAKLNAAHGYTFETLKEASAVEAWTDEFLVLEMSGWKGMAGSALNCDPRTAAMFRAAMSGGFASGRLQVHALRVQGRAIAMTTYFVRDGRAYGFKSCFDEAFAVYAPGLLLLEEMMRELSVPINFDSCADARQVALNDIWRGRREILAICVSLGKRRKWAYAAAMALRDAWHRLKAPRA